MIIKNLKFEYVSRDMRLHVDWIKNWIPISNHPMKCRAAFAFARKDILPKQVFLWTLNKANIAKL